MSGSFFRGDVAERDPLVADALDDELRRQGNQIELIASENIVSRAVLQALGHAMANKTLEGYPGARFHGGGQFVDVVEQAAIDRARELFECSYVNVQPHSGTQANQAVFFATLRPGDTVLSMDLAAGGHLSHGAAPNQSGRWFDAHHYGVRRQDGRIDYDEVAAQAEQLRPKLIIAGGSAYPRCIDFARMAQIARRVDALFLVDMAHIAGLVAARAHPSPIPHADIVTCTTTKTLRGPRGGLILARDDKWRKKFQSAIFPGVQGSMHSQVIAAKAVCLGEALEDDFRVYGADVVNNARALAAALKARGNHLVSDGTDTHLVLLDLSTRGLRGQAVQDALEAVNITSNKNPIPFDAARPADWHGVRLGVAAATTRGMKESDFATIGAVIADVIDGLASGEEVPAHARERVAQLCATYPIYG